MERSLQLFNTFFCRTTLGVKENFENANRTLSAGLVNTFDLLIDTWNCEVIGDLYRGVKESVSTFFFRSLPLRYQCE